jgi:hypothetical protein
MNDSEHCPECGVPEYITGEHSWLDNGDIVHSRDRARRLVFVESENIDPLIRGIEELLDQSIEHIVIASSQENIRVPLSLFVPRDLRERVRNHETDYRPILDTFADISRNMGRGVLEILDLRHEGDENDFCAFRMTEPFSLYLNCGARAAGLEAILGYAHSVRYEQVSPLVYDITVFPATHSEGLERMFRDDYRHRKGDIVLERCPTCGGPKALGAYDWNQERGVIVDSSTQRRMVMLAPYELDPVFQELEDELGPTIPSVVIEAMRRYTSAGFFSLWDSAMDEDEFRMQFALRGLGNVREAKARRSGLRLRLDNAVLHLLIVGSMQGAFEAVTGAASRVEWELSANGELEVAVTPRR